VMEGMLRSDDRAPMMGSHVAPVESCTVFASTPGSVHRKLT